MTRFYLLFFLLISFNNFSFAQSPDTVIYSVVSSGGAIKGFDKIWKNADGSYGEWYQYNDRGRGDSLRIIFREDAEGFPLFLKVSGNDYMKNSVSEEFSLANGVAKWKNNAEDEQNEVTGKFFYLGLKSGGGHIIKALKANNNKIKMLPSGETELTIIEKHVLGNGPETKLVWLAQVKGFGLTPAYSWIDSDNIDFAYVNEWQSSIHKGYENYIDELLAIQKKYESAFYSNLAATIPQKMDEWTLIKDVSLFDAEQAIILMPKDVL
ncbi:MAG: hypothetical protein M3O67_03565, partial [Bacteroidota bacterium]|nr:hypothetical protein [Bacteroidota bacterium]